jgi:hypothetical protein
MNKSILLVLLVLCAINLVSQTPSQPLELPNFIIEGKEQIDVQVGTKQVPEYSFYLERSQMDSLILVGKPRNYVVFPITFPTTIIAKKFPDGYLIGNLGSFLSADISAGYKTYYNNYEIFPYATLDASKGHLENANYVKFNLGLQTDYVAPEKFYIFGGSKTTTNLDFDFKSYKLYALGNAPHRNQYNLNAQVISIGNFEGYDFQTGARFYTVNLTSSGTTISENLLGGFLEMKNRQVSSNYGGRISLDFRSFENKSTNFFEALGFAKFDIQSFELEPKIGLQVATSSLGKTRLMVLVTAEGRKQVSRDVSIYGKISNQMRNQSFRDFLKENPYLADSLVIDFANVSEVQAKIKYQPSKDLSFVFGAGFSINSRLPILAFSDTGYFNITYVDASVFTLGTEGYWTSSKIGNFSLAVQISPSSQSSNKKDLPLLPLVKLRADYSRTLLEKLRLKAFFEYVGKRFADIENNLTLPDYNNLGISADYSLNSSTIFSINVENLLNSNIIYWYGYKEWGFNFKFGVTYKF